MRHFIVVYQFGKVASTSLVATLNALPGVEAVQAHFLGRDNLKEMVDLIVDPGTSEYFHKHQVGQFVENAKTTRIINFYRQGREAESDLSIISLCRNPFNWFRSSIIQDMAGYLPVLQALHVGYEQDSVDDEVRTRQALGRVLVQFSEIIRDFGGIDELLDHPKGHNKALSEHPFFSGNRSLLRMFYMMLRPFSWFETHYRKAICYDVGDLPEIDQGVLFRGVGWASLFVLRYEDLEAHIKVAAERLRIGPIEQLVRENVSDRKEMFEPVRQAFASEPARVLQAQFAATKYSRRFGYS